jgi:hypothetical protein
MKLIQGAALMVGASGEDDLVKLVKERLHRLQTFGRGWGRRIVGKLEQSDSACCVTAAKITLALVAR